MHDKVGGAEQAAWRIINAEKGLCGTALITSSATKKFKTDLRVYQIPVGFSGIGTNVRLGIYPFNGTVYREVKRILEEEKADVLHLHNFKYFGFSAIEAARSLGVKVVFSVYDYWMFCPLSTLYVKRKNKICYRYQGAGCTECFGIPGLGFQLRKILFRKFQDRIDAFIVISEDERKILLENGVPRGKISLSSLVIDIRPPARVRKEKGKVLYAGWIVPHKGLDLVIRGLKGTRYSLDVAGEGIGDGYVDECLRLAREGGVRMKLIGKLPNEEVIAKMAECEYFAVPERWRIPLPTVMLEAMAVGSKVVGNNCGCIKDYLPKTNLFNGAEDFAECLSKAKYIKRENDNSAVVDGILGVYRGVVGERNG
jgi:glycosyltransferase involved in cell wall biosynthesis